VNILLYKINPISGGEEIELYIEISAGENAERSKFTVNAEMFFELGFSVEFKNILPITREKYEDIRAYSQKNEAVKKGISLLSFSDNTKKGLQKKLVSKGFSRESAEYASDFLEKAGDINELESAKALARDMACKKLYGAKRINASLYQKGFSGEAISHSMEDDDIDFVLICAKRIEKMGGREIFADRDEKRKAIAALTRYGFSYDDIKDALKMKR
jgi:SOS response regulatory protein OraA/RecX